MSLCLRIIGTGKPLVLLHGWGLNSGVFDHVARALADRYTCHLIDLPGFGENASQPMTNLNDVAQQLVEVIPQGSVVLGWSLGGLVATQLALAHPKHVSKLIVVASSPKFQAEPAAAQESGWPGIAPKVLQAFEVQLEQDYHSTLQRFMAIQAMGSPTAKADILALRDAIEAYPPPFEASLLQGLSWLSSIDMRSDLKAITQPTLRIYGRLDALVPQAAVTAIQVLQPAAKTVIMEHVSHAPFMTNLSEFNAEVIDFIEN